MELAAYPPGVQSVRADAVHPVEGPQDHVDLPAPDLEFRWIEDEGLLRDEGVMFGLASDGAGLKAKEDCIRSYFRRQIAATERHRQAVVVEQEETNGQANAIRAAIGALDRAEMTQSSAGLSDSGVSHLVRYALGAVLAIGVCAANSVLVYEILSPAFASPVWITAGVVLAGLFMLFHPTSLLFTSDEAQRATPGSAELWKLRLTEIGLPIAAAGFIVAWGGEQLGLLRGLATFIFLALLLLFAGRLLLSLVPPIGDAVSRMVQRRAGRRDTVTRLQRLGELEDQLTVLAGRSAELRKELASILSEAEWNATCDAKLALFQSEFELAAAKRPAPLAAPRPVLNSVHGVA